MPTTHSTQLLSTELPEIEKSDLDAVRNFLIADGEIVDRPRSKGFSAPTKGPTVRFGITRARTRSTTKVVS